jgi:nicotinate-nucleotide--dimethylbenzimidazole phosphoribosyltransferase
MQPQEEWNILPLCAAAKKAAQQKWDQIAKPLRSLGRLEDMVIQLAGITGSAEIPPRKKAVLIFCADNGVVEEGVTQSSNTVTATVARNFTKGIATINSLSRECGADVFPIDIGMAQDIDCQGLDNRKFAHGTRNLAKEPAMTRAEAVRAIETGISLVGEKKAQGYNLIITGEMGIGNTTTSSAVLSVLEHVAPEQVTGRGAGLTHDGVQHKIAVIQKAIALHQPDAEDVLDVLSKVGGFDICAMAGAFLGGAIFRVPVLIDGFISAVSANCAVRLAPLCKDYMFASHCSAEPAGRFALDCLGMKAYLECGMCLGEGTGAVIGAKLLDFALAAYAEVADFQEAEVEAYALLQ